MSLPLLFICLQAGCLWSGSRLACLPLPCICLPFPFICLPLLLSPMFVTANFCPFPLAMQHFYSCPRSVTAGVPFQHFYSLVSQVCHCWCPPFSRWRCNISIHLFSRSVTASALFRWPCSISIHLFPGSVTGAAALFRWPCSISIHLSPM